MHDLDPVAGRAHAASSWTAARTSPSGTRQPCLTSPGAATSTNGTSEPRRFLSWERTASTSSVGAPESVTGSPRAAQQLEHLLTQPVLAGEAKGGQQPQSDRLAVAVAAVAGARLDRVADGVAEVQHLAETLVAFIGRHHLELGTGAREDHPLIDLPAGGDRLPQRPAGDQGGLQHLHPPRRQLLAGKARERARVDHHARRLVVGADVVLGVGKVDPGLAPVGGVDLGDEAGGHLHVGDPPLVGGRAEAGQVPHHPAPEGHDVVGPGELGAQQRLATRVRPRRRVLWASPAGIAMRPAA